MHDSGTYVKFTAAGAAFVHLMVDLETGVNLRHNARAGCPLQRRGDFARKHNISPEQARELMQKVGQQPRQAQ